nr:DNA glycosylase [uncultured Methanobrevibacter sp.]
MILRTPIDLELTQLSGQTSQPPWCEVDGTFSNVVDVNGNHAVFNVKQSDEFLDFNYSGDVSDSQAIDKLNYIFDLDFDLDKFYKYLGNHAELAEIPEFCSGLSQKMDQINFSDKTELGKSARQLLHFS